MTISLPARYLKFMAHKNKQTSAPLPGAKMAPQRADALRQNLSKRKQQARARDSEEQK